MTKKHRAEGEQAESLRFLSHQIIFEAAPDGLLVVDEEGVIRDANQQAVRLLGYGRDELRGLEVEVLVPTEARERHRDQRAGFLGQPRARPMGIGMELRALRKDGRSVPVEISLSPCRTPEGIFVIAAVRDVSERNQLRNLGAGTLRAAEEERRRIARELHDDTAQCLAALLVHLRVLRRTEDRAARERLFDEMAEELSVAVEGVRRISRGLRPPALEDVGVEAAIRSHVRGVADRSDLEVELDLETVGRRIDPDAQLVIYRVVQEAVTNITRHADARRAAVRLSRDEDEVVVRVEDDGKGFDHDRVLLEGGGLGLLGMHERARLAGGHLHLESAPGKGTVVELRIPAEGAVASSAGGSAHG